MAIEQPEEPSSSALELAVAADQLTIGEFYAAIADQLKAAGAAAFTGDPGRQVTHQLGQEGLIAITGLDSALSRGSAPSSRRARAPRSHRSIRGG